MLSLKNTANIETAEKPREKVKAELKKKDEELAFFYEHHLPDLKRL